jgi:small subunit ribosomal protein S4
MPQDPQCKICRRVGRKLFLKGDRCFSPKCAMVKKPYAPGSSGKRKRGSFSEYSKELREKQKLKNWYGLSEKQFFGYAREILSKAHSKDSNQEENPSEAFARILESRLDNVVYRMGFAPSRKQARQLVNHGHFFLNGKPIDIPSALTKKGDKIIVRSNSIKNEHFTALKISLKKYQPPAWLKVDKEKLEGEIINSPTLEEIAPPAEISSIFEFYSR